MQVCTSLQTDNHANTSLLSFFTGRMPFLPPNQQRQSTEGKYEATNSGAKFRKLGGLGRLGVRQGHGQRHHSIQRVQLPIRL